MRYFVSFNFLFFSFFTSFADELGGLTKEEKSIPGLGVPERFFEYDPVPIPVANPRPKKQTLQNIGQLKNYNKGPAADLIKSCKSNVSKSNNSVNAVETSLRNSKIINGRFNKKPKRIKQSFILQGFVNLLENPQILKELQVESTSVLSSDPEANDNGKDPALKTSKEAFVYLDKIPPGAILQYEEDGKALLEVKSGKEEYCSQSLSSAPFGGSDFRSSSRVLVGIWVKVKPKQ